MFYYLFTFNEDAFNLGSDSIRAVFVFFDLKTTFSTLMKSVDLHSTSISLSLQSTGHCQSLIFHENIFLLS